MKLIHGLIERLAFACTIITVAFVSMFIAIVWPSGAVSFMDGAVRGMMKLDSEGPSPFAPFKGGDNTGQEQEPETN